MLVYVNSVDIVVIGILDVVCGNVCLLCSSCGDLVLLLCLLVLLLCWLVCLPWSWVWDLVLFGCSWLLFWCVCVLGFVLLVGWLPALLLVFGFALRFWVWMVGVGVRGGCGVIWWLFWVYCGLLVGVGFGLCRCSS